MNRRHTSKLKKMLSHIKHSGSEAVDSLFESPTRAWLIRQSRNTEENTHLMNAFQIMVNTFAGDILQKSRVRIANQSYISVDVVFQDTKAMESFKYIFTDPNYIELPEKDK